MWGFRIPRWGIGQAFGVRLAIVGLVSAVPTLLPNAAAADQGASVVAESYGSLLPGARIAIRVERESDLNIRLADVFARALTGAGFEVGEPAAYIWSFDTEVESDPAGPPAVELFWQLRQAARRGGLRRPHQVVTVRAGRCAGPRVTVAVDLGPPDRPCIWAAVMSTIRQNADRFMLAARMAEELVAIAGETVERETVRLD